MQIEICPSHGDFCKTFETRVQTTSNVEVLEEDNLGQSKLALTGC